MLLVDMLGDEENIQEIQTAAREAIGRIRPNFDGSNETYAFADADIMPSDTPFGSAGDI